MDGSNGEQPVASGRVRPVALITGASRGLGLALARALANRGWALVIDARGEARLGDALMELSTATKVRAIPGDVSDERHRDDLVRAAEELGRLDLLVNNASTLGLSPQPTLDRYPLEEIARVYGVNGLAPLGLFQRALPLLRSSAGRVVNMTSDAAIEGYQGWGGYGSSKAALEQLSKVLSVEHPELKIYWVDPGDMKTQMQQEAFPGEDISDRPPPEASIPGMLRLIEGNMPSGRYQARDLALPAVLEKAGSAA